MNVYGARRTRLMAQMQAGGVAVIPTAPTATRNNDCDYPYRHDSYFYYLSGVTEPDSVLVLVAPGAGGPGRTILFCRARNVEREIWDGCRLGPRDARTSFGFDAAYPIEELDVEMSKLLANAPALYYAMGKRASFDAQIKLWLRNVRRQTGAATPAIAYDVLTLLDEMRLFKDDAEQGIMEHAAAISGHAHRRVMQHSRPGMYEYQIEAELLYAFRKSGAQSPAYTSIVAAGANACILHYTANNAIAKNGDLILVDAGCELDGYASDITRTYPVNGRFSAPQRALYELVLAAQAAALDAVQPGLCFQGVHDAAVLVLAQGMLDIGLLDKNSAGSVEDVIADKSYRKFYMHGTGHWLGMDVHDVGQYRETAAAGNPSRQLQPGMALTVEPGIYVRPAEGVPPTLWNIGIRIEDDVLVTPGGHKIMSGAAPKAVAEIEQLMHPT